MLYICIVIQSFYYRMADMWCLRNNIISIAKSYQIKSKHTKYNKY